MRGLHCLRVAAVAFRKSMQDNSVLVGFLPERNSLFFLSWRVKNNALSWSRTAEGDSCQGVTLCWSGNSFVGRSPSVGSHGR